MSTKGNKMLLVLIVVLRVKMKLSQLNPQAVCLVLKTEKKLGKSPKKIIQKMTVSKMNHQLMKTTIMKVMTKLRQKITLVSLITENQTRTQVSKMRKTVYWTVKVRKRARLRVRLKGAMLKMGLVRRRIVRKNLMSLNVTKPMCMVTLWIQSKIPAFRLSFNLACVKRHQQLM